MARADAVVCPSRATARDAAALLGAQPERTVVAPHGPGQGLPPAEAAERRHFLYLGSDEPRKRVGSLVEAHGELGGTPGWCWPARRRGAPGPRGPRASPTPRPPRWPSCWPARWRWCTRRRWRASASPCWRRWRPGFPWWPFAARRSEEVCGDAALLVAPGELAATLRRVADDDELRERLAAAGRERAASFSWERSAELHAEAYRLAAGA